VSISDDGSEQILSGTSAQIGYTLPFTTVYTGKYKQKTNQKQTLLKLSTTQKKQTTQNTAKQKYAGSVAFSDTRPWYDVGLSTMLPSQHWVNRQSSVYLLDSVRISASVGGSLQSGMNTINDNGSWDSARRLYTQTTTPGQCILQLHTDPNH